VAIELKVPPVGESVTEVQIGEWVKGEGQRVQRDEVIVKIETDKVTVDLPAPVAGVIKQVVRKQGQSAAVGDVIGFLEEGGAEEPAPAPAASKSSSPPASRRVTASATRCRRKASPA
jgi:2-oxoglutarate dehydrogenase E2 component (dihydrolipoamide succinyltransferase)